ncbi:MAG: hypothetical protein QM762_17890 [Chryseolinea sp.]
MRKFSILSNCFLFLVVLKYTSAFSQSDPSSAFRKSIVAPAPDAANLGRFGEYPVNLSNGLVDISIPIFEIKSGGIKMPISLSYHSGGVKAYDIASVVGLGWSLNAGGAITRSINGLPDESNRGILYNPIPDQFDPGQYFACFLAHLSDPYNAADGQSDNFFYNLNGSSGKFVFKEVPSNGSPWEIVTIPAKPVKITVSTDFNAFTIVDEDGTTYEFASPESTQVMGNIGAISDCNTAWYLSKITSPNKTDQIIFSYSASSHIVTLTGGNSMTERDQPQYSLTSRVSYSKTGTTSTHQPIHLEEIIFNNGKVTFDYKQDRVDVTGGLRLSDINVFQQQSGGYTKIKQFKLSQSYFEATNVQISQVAHLLNPDLNPDVFKKRLRLDSISELGFYGGVQHDIPPYKFTYEGGQFPYYGTTAQDFTGLYNGATGNKNLLFYDMGSDNNGYRIAKEFGANRDVNPSTAKVGTLKRIDFPTGGYTEFQIEPNKVETSWTNITPVHTTWGPYVLSSFAGQYQMPIVVTPEMTGESDRVQAVFTLDNIYSDPSKQISTTVSIYDETTHSYANFLVQVFPGGTSPAQIGIPAQTATFSRTEQLELIRGHSYIFSIGDPINFPSGTGNRVIATINWQANNGTVSTVVNGTLYTGGLRIKEIASSDGSGGVLRKSYNYKKWYFNSNLFNGSIDELADRFKVRSSNNAAGSIGIKTYYNNYGENFTFQLGGSNSNTVSYEEVEEMQLDGAGNPLGKTSYTFRTAVDQTPSYLPYFKTDNSWKREQILNKSVFGINPSGIFVKLQEQVNEYTDTPLGSIKSYMSVLKHDDYIPGGNNLPIRQCLQYIAGNLYDWIDFPQYLYWSKLESTTTTQFDQEGLRPQVTTIAYQYDNDYHKQITRSAQTTSNAKTVFNNYKYAGDYPLVPCNQQTCYDSYNVQVLSLKSQRKTCEETYFSAYLQATVNNNSAAATTAFDNYLACKGTFQSNVVTTAVPALNQCLSIYNDCLDDLITSGTIPDKAVITMVRDNIVNVAIETTTGFSENEAEYVTKFAKTDYKLLTNGGVEQDVVSGFDSRTPVLKDNFDANKLGFSRKLGQFPTYDEAHNILEVQKNNDIVVSYVWDYKSEFPIAEVSNAKSIEIAYTSFESDGTGNWSVVGSSRSSSDSRTGSKSYRLSDGSISKSGFSTTKSFVVSFWSKDGTVSVTNTSSHITGSTILGWTYHEYHIDAQASTGNVTLSGSALIDELRFYPANAQMKTFTYEPLIGTTSSADANGAVTYYDYDAHGRLIRISDDKRNTMKVIKYHYAGEE